MTEWMLTLSQVTPATKFVCPNGMANFVAGAAASEELDLPTRVGRTSSEEECPCPHQTPMRFE